MRRMHVSLVLVVRGHAAHAQRACEGTLAWAAVCKPGRQGPILAQRLSLLCVGQQAAALIHGRHSPFLFILAATNTKMTTGFCTGDAKPHVLMRSHTSA